MGNKMAIVEVGPWGSKDGVTPWIFKPDDLIRITKICIASGECINSITFTYEDCHGTHTSTRFGGDGGENYTITFAEDEEITWISGTFGQHHDNITVITSLSLNTNKKDDESHGQKVGTSFSLPVAKGKFIGFYGTYGNYVESFGAILQSVYN